MDKYLDRNHEIHLLKESFPIGAIAERSQTQNIYSKELLEIRQLWASLAN